jgi:hypothetical protein
MQACGRSVASALRRWDYRGLGATEGVAHSLKRKKGYAEAQPEV